jgi:hypothetical protein
VEFQQAFRRVWASAATLTAPIASVDTGTIRQRFNMDWCTDPTTGGQDTYWWWARSIRVDPNEVIADDDEGGIWSIPFTTDGTDTVTFGTPVRVAETYVPVQAGEGQAATAAVQRRRQRVAASALERPSKPTRSNQAAAESAPANERNPMDAAVLQALARLHGLDPDAATEDQVNAAVLAANQNPEPESNPAGGTPEPEPEAPAVTPELVAASTELHELFGLPSTATAEQIAEAARELRDGAQAGARVAAQAQASELDQTVDTAVSDGRIAPSARDAWRAAIDPGERPDAAATARATAERERLAGLATGRVPVRERGSIPDPQASEPESLKKVLSGLASTRNRRSGATTQEVIRRG